MDVPPDCPGPTIVALKGDSIPITVKNELDEPHSFYIPGIIDTGPIAPGATFTGTLTASVSGSHMYYDNLNEPVNRVMGLHGALVVRPVSPAFGHKFTPYDNPSSHVQALYDDFGSSTHFPGLSWQDGDPATNTPPYRTYAWLLHQASPKLFAEVGNLSPGVIYDPQLFQQKFLRSPFDRTRATSYNPEYFTINGQSGFFSHFSPSITPMGRIGEPVVIHIMNAGLWTHSMHFHANHFFVTSVNGVSSENPIWVDVYGILPMDRVDYTLPFMRPPSIPNTRGIGVPDTPLTTLNGNPCYPPLEEFELHFPREGQVMRWAENANPQVDPPTIDLTQRMSPLCYPMHDHTEPSQTAQGGNYNCGLISGIYIIGDRTVPGAMNFPMDADFAMMFRNIRGISGSTGESGTLPAAGTPPA